MRTWLVGAALILGSAACSQSAPADVSAHTTPIACTLTTLHVSLDDRGGAAAGSTGFLINFTNSATSACTLDGFPGVSYVRSAGGSPVGQPASRSGDPAGIVTLAPGDTAHSQVVATNIMNYPASDCQPTDVTGISVYPPNSFDAIFLPRPATACELTAPHQLSVTSVSR